MKKIPIRTILEQLRSSGNREKTAIADAVSTYLDTTDPVALQKLIPFNNAYHLWDLSRTAAALEDTDAFGVLDFLVHAMGISTTPFPVVRSTYDYPGHQSQSPAEDFVAAFLNHFDPEPDTQKPNHPDAIARHLVDAASRFGVSLLQLAACLLSGAAIRFKFGWTPSTGQSSYFGCALNVVFSSVEPPTPNAAINEFDRIVWDLTDSDMLELLKRQIEAPVGRYGPHAHCFGKLHGSLAAIKPHIIEQFLNQASPPQTATLSWRHVVRATGRFDPQAIAFAQSSPATEALRLLILIDTLRPGTCTSEALAKAFDPECHPDESGMIYIRDHHPDKLPDYLSACLADPTKLISLTMHTLQTTFQSLPRQWNRGGREVAMAMANAPLVPASSYGDGKATLQGIALRGLLEAETLPDASDLREFLSGVLHVVAATPSAGKDPLEIRRYLFTPIAEHHSGVFSTELWSLLNDKSKVLRELAIHGLAKLPADKVLQPAIDLLESKKSDVRASTAELLGKIANSAAILPLLTLLESESHDVVRAALRQAIHDCGGCIPEEAFDLDGFLTRHSKGLKLPTCPWLEPGSLPTLQSIAGTAFSEAAITLLIAKQSKHKEIAAAPDILPLLAHIDRETSAPFATALVEGFLNSDQAASDRWALTFGGLLGDNRIITLLLPRIQDWCENSRHKLAEYAAQAISLLPGNEPLMVLDTLSNRYRSKFKNVGKACAEAFNAAATARGITADELADMVVPDFGFDADGLRRFDWQGGGVSAELTPDFKLTWFDADTDKSWKSLPASAPDDIKTEVKTLTKLLREAVKGQTARLELTLVRQRRWPVAKWRELYENHPLLRSFASNLVWGIYDSTGTLLRTFRRYPNGLLADAAGNLEELTETDTVIGMVHPLELDTPSLDAWRAHLARFKVKPPFPQIDRPVELMDPLHGNRKSISLTDGKKLSAGTFKSRAEKRGWVRGSVVDAGGISSYYKLYPGAGVEVVLPTENFWVGCDPMEEIELGAACFAKSGTIERGSYVYNEPGPDDPRVLRFDQVPPVVFSETLADLKAIIATKE